MRKIAILTLPLHSNYGGILQNFALQKTIKSLGEEPVTINLRSKEGPKTKDFVFNIIKKAINIVPGRKVKYVTPKEIKQIKFNYVNFIENYINSTETITEETKLKEHFTKSNYAAIVIGSDQTWRPKYTPNIFNYFLNFLDDDFNLKIRKTAYASSFGTSDWEFDDIETKKCSELAKKFDAVSVREESAVDLCEKHLGISAEWVLDPTLLLDRQHYIDLFKNDKQEKNKGLYTYILDSDDLKMQTIKTVSENLNLKEFNNQPKESLRSVRYKTIDNYVFPSIEDWIKGFNDADFVVTDSFHGCVFCIIFNKPFIVIGNEDRGLARFQSLLKIFQLEDRLIFKSSQLTDDLIQRPIDWQNVNAIHEKERIRSIDFLKRSIQN